MMRRTKVSIFHQIDPLEGKVEGITTFVKNFIKYAPEDFDIEFVGITSNKKENVIGSWQETKLFDKKFRFLPTMFVRNENERTAIPLTLKFTLSLVKYRHKISPEDRILEFHRMETGIPFTYVKANKVLFLHEHPIDLYNPQTDERWAKIPWLYFYLEKGHIKQFSRIFMVREDGVRYYKKRYLQLKERIFFIPTWVDAETFYPYIDAKREKERLRFIKENAFLMHDKLILFVGRFEGQKDPLLLIDSFYFLQKKIPNVRLCVVGAGGMKDKIERKVREYNLAEKVRFTGALPQHKVAELMRISDVFLLASAFEGMPRSVLEALACGLPVVSPDVGEVRRVVKDGVSGIICTERTPAMLGDAVIAILKSDKFSPENCIRSIQNYTAERILGNLYQSYYQLCETK